MMNTEMAYFDGQMNPFFNQPYYIPPSNQQPFPGNNVYFANQNTNQLKIKNQLENPIIIHHPHTYTNINHHNQNPKPNQPVNLNNKTLPADYAKMIHFDDPGKVQEEIPRPGNPQDQGNFQFFQEQKYNNNNNLRGTNNQIKIYSPRNNQYINAENQYKNVNPGAIQKKNYQNDIYKKEVKQEKIGNAQYQNVPPSSKNARTPEIESKGISFQNNTYKKASKNEELNQYNGFANLNRIKTPSPNQFNYMPNSNSNFNQIRPYPQNARAVFQNAGINNPQKDQMNALKFQNINNHSNNQILRENNPKNFNINKNNQSKGYSQIPLKNPVYQNEQDSPVLDAEINMENNFIINKLNYASKDKDPNVSKYNQKTNIKESFVPEISKTRTSRVLSPDRRSTKKSNSPNFNNNKDPVFFSEVNFNKREEVKKLNANNVNKMCYATFQNSKQPPKNEIIVKNNFKIKIPNIVIHTFKGTKFSRTKGMNYDQLFFKAFGYDSNQQNREFIDEKEYEIEELKGTITSLKDQNPSYSSPQYQNFKESKSSSKTPVNPSNNVYYYQGYSMTPPDNSRFEMNRQVPQIQYRNPPMNYYYPYNNFSQPFI